MRVSPLGGGGFEGEALEGWLGRELGRVVLRGERFALLGFEYRNRRVYEKIMEIPRGRTATYLEIARASKVKYAEMLTALMGNPFQALISCHRLVTKKGTLMGFYPLGVEVKRRLLEVEGAKL